MEKCGKLNFQLEILQSDDMVSVMGGQWLGQKRKRPFTYRTGVVKAFMKIPSSPIKKRYPRSIMSRVKCVCENGPLKLRLTGDESHSL